ncbi:MAG: hypothetical protein K0R38_2403 [Polyangiaceae bacterium]|nr:hypothetical protein [Polyangiaceae bacterium]
MVGGALREPVSRAAFARSGCEERTRLEHFATTVASRHAFHVRTKLRFRSKARSCAIVAFGIPLAVGRRMNNIIYIVGLVVVVIAVLSFFGLR